MKSITYLILTSLRMKLEIILLLFLRFSMNLSGLPRIEGEGWITSNSSDELMARRMVIIIEKFHWN